MVNYVVDGVLKLFERGENGRILNSEYGLLHDNLLEDELVIGEPIDVCGVRESEVVASFDVQSGVVELGVVIVVDSQVLAGVNAIGPVLAGC